MNNRLRLSHTMAEIAFEQPGPEYRKVATVLAVQLESDAEIETREGWLQANKGDYLVVNTQDRTYPWPVRKEIFEKTYVLIKEKKPE